MWRLPLLGIAPSRLRVGSSACTALLSSVTCTSPSSRQPIRDVTLGLGFLRNPSPYALRLAPPPIVSESTYAVTPFPMTIVRILRAVLSTGCLWQCRPVSAYGCRRPILCLLAPASQPLGAGLQLRWLNHTFASAAHRCLLNGIPGVRLPGSAFYPRSRPLRTSRRPGR